MKCKGGSGQLLTNFSATNTGQLFRNGQSERGAQVGIRTPAKIFVLVLCVQTPR